MDEDIDFDDLLGEEKPDIDSEDRNAASTEAAAAHPVNLSDLANAPTERELALARQVQDLQRERDRLQTEVKRLRELPGSDTPAGPDDVPKPSDPYGPITIPHNILPVLSILRKHIADLTRDNAALRYVFMGGPMPGSGGSTAESGDTEMTGSSGPQLARIEVEGGQGVKLEQIVTRVKALVQENEELGELVMSLGKASPDVWQQALDDSRAVIESLDGDLEQHLATIKDLRQQLDEARRSAKAPPKGPAKPPEAPRGPSASSSSHHAASSSSAYTNGSNRSQSRNTPIQRPHHQHRPSTGGNTPSTSSAAPKSMGIGILGAAAGRQDTLGLPERDKRRERDRDSQSSGVSGGAGVPPSGPGGGTSRSGQDRGGSGRREERERGHGSKDPPRGPRDDRDFKRRR